MPDEHAVLIESEGRCTLRFQRLLAHDRERVWRALTERDELVAWHPSPFLLRGEVVEFQPTPGIPEIAPGRLLAFEPPGLLAYTWTQDELRFTLTDSEEGGCLLTLEHTFDDRFKAARDGAGWHLCLRSLAASLKGETEGPHEGRDLPDGWSELNASYQQRFHILPEQATPIPPR